MNKKVVITIACCVLTGALVIGGSIFGYNKYQNAYKPIGIEKFAQMKVLTVYYDKNGETEVVAKSIHSAAGGDIVKLEPAKAYPKDEKKYQERIKQEKHEKKSIALKKRPDINKYDVIFVGTPVELYTMSPTVKSFLKEGDFTGKIVAPFVVYSANTGGTVTTNIRRLVPSAVVVNPYIESSADNEYLDEKIKGWLNTINVKRKILK